MEFKLILLLFTSHYFKRMATNVTVEMTSEHQLKKETVRRDVRIHQVNFVEENNITVFIQVCVFNYILKYFNELT